jgi:hypothetical protein
VVGTLLAGHLLRRHGRASAILLPYAEVIFPGTLALLVGLGLPLKIGFNLAVPGALEFSLALLAALLAITAALRGWPWPVRLILHALWVGGVVGALVVAQTGG